MVTYLRKELEMGQRFLFDTTAQLYESELGSLAIRFADDLVFEYVGGKSGQSFVRDAISLLEQEQQPEEWRLIPCRKLFNGEQKWRLVSSMGFLDGDRSRPALVLEVRPEALGGQARQYLKTDLPQTLQ